MSAVLTEYPASTYIPGTEIHLVSVWTCGICGDRYTSRPGEISIATQIDWHQRMMHDGDYTPGEHRVITLTVIKSPKRRHHYAL